MPHTEVLSLSMNDLETMRKDFPEEWKELIHNAYQRFTLEAKLKLEALKHCEKVLNLQQKKRYIREKTRLMGKLGEQAFSFDSEN